MKNTPALEEISMHLPTPTTWQTAYISRTALDLDPRPGTRDLPQTALGALGIEILKADNAGVIMRMPLAKQGTRGALLVLAESVASTAAGLHVGAERRAFGAELNAQISSESVTGEHAYCRASAYLLTDARHTWEVEAVTENGEPLLKGRCTLGIVVT